MQQVLGTSCKTRIRAILFDLGETILNFGKVDIGKLFKEGAKHTYEYLKSLDQPLEDFKPYCWRNLAAVRWNWLISHFKRRDFDSLELLRKINSRKGIKLEEHQWAELAWLWYEPLSREAVIEPDLKGTLDKLKDMGIKLGILSNTFVHAYALEKQMAQAGFLDCFDIRMYSYQFKYRKPSKHIFQIAADGIDEKFENIMYVGDRLDKDVRPSLKLGMTAVLKKAYTNNSKKLPPGAHKIETISQLPTLIDKLNS